MGLHNKMFYNTYYFRQVDGVYERFVTREPLSGVSLSGVYGVGSYFHCVKYKHTKKKSMKHYKRRAKRK